MKTEPKILPGMMELLPSDQIVFNQIKDTIKEVYESFGFFPLDTPVLEYSNVLLAKAGGDTEKQIYRFNKGDNDISLRFDLTVPLARYVSMHSADLVYPFKRYQIGKVYRGERPQKGRFREFYQCDIDAIGNETLSLIYDAEMPAIIYNIFSKLNFGKFTIRINNRKILNGLFNYLNLSTDSANILRIIDKIAKIGIDAVKEELISLNIPNSQINTILDFISIKGSVTEILTKLKNLNIEDEVFKKGIEELEIVTNYLKYYNVPDDYYAIDLTIARGLDYYTGSVYETTLDNYPSIGSICSGGRYENLTNYYSKENLIGVGISIGLTRLFYQLKEENLLPNLSHSKIQALVVPLDNNYLKNAISIASELRKENIITDVYYEEKGMKQKIRFADRLSIPYVILTGEDEAKTNSVTIKDLQTSTQETTSLESAIKKIKGEN